MWKHARFIGLVFVLVPAITALMCLASTRPAWADELDDDAAAALRSLYEGSPAARALGAKAAGILVFPNIVKAGFLFGAQFGEGTLFRGDRRVANYRSVAGSYGFQAGVQTFGYAMFLMPNRPSSIWTRAAAGSLASARASSSSTSVSPGISRRLRSKATSTLLSSTRRDHGGGRNPGLEDHEGQSLTRRSMRAAFSPS